MRLKCLLKCFKAFIYFSGHTIFVLSGQAAGKYAGPSIIISFIIGGILALLSALSMSEMSSIMSSSGSVYTYIYIGKFVILFLCLHLKSQSVFRYMYCSSRRYVQSIKSS